MTKHIPVPEEVLKEAARVIEFYADFGSIASILRALLDGPGVEAVWEVVAFGSNLHEVSWKNGTLPPLGAKLYIAAPSAPVPSDDQGPLSKARLKRLVTQVFGEGWQIVPPSAPVQAVPVAECAKCSFSSCSAGCTHYRNLITAAPQPPATTDKENGNGL